MIFDSAHLSMNMMAASRRVYVIETESYRISIIRLLVRTIEETMLLSITPNPCGDSAAKEIIFDDIDIKAEFHVCQEFTYPEFPAQPIFLIFPMTPAIPNNTYLPGSLQEYLPVSL